MTTRVGAAARTVRDATRFTSTTPYAAVAGRPSVSPLAATSIARAVFSSSPPPPRPSRATRIPGETPEERVARLRRAHDAARSAQVSTVDKIIIVAREYADKAHRATIFVLMGFTALCFCFTVFAVFDMIRFNKNRRREFDERMASFQAGSLEEARIAYISGIASDAQTAMVLEAERIVATRGGKLPPLLLPPSEGTLAETAFGKARSEDRPTEASGPTDVGFVVEGTDNKISSGEPQDADKSGSIADQKKAWWKVW